MFLRLPGGKSTQETKEKRRTPTGPEQDFWHQAGPRAARPRFFALDWTRGGTRPGFVEDFRYMFDRFFERFGGVFSDTCLLIFLYLSCALVAFPY